MLTTEIVNKVTQVVHFYEYSMKNNFKKTRDKNNYKIKKRKMSNIDEC